MLIASPMPGPGVAISLIAKEHGWSADSCVGDEEKLLQTLTDALCQLIILDDKVSKALDALVDRIRAIPKHLMTPILILESVHFEDSENHLPEVDGRRQVIWMRMSRVANEGRTGLAALLKLDAPAQAAAS